jgi:hypothetical protein
MKGAPLSRAERRQMGWVLGYLKESGTPSYIHLAKGERDAKPLTKIPPGILNSLSASGHWIGGHAVNTRDLSPSIGHMPRLDGTELDSNESRDRMVRSAPEIPFDPDPSLLLAFLAESVAFANAEIDVSDFWARRAFD